jgi:hypothetical protein
MSTETVDFVTIADNRVPVLISDFGLDGVNAWILKFMNRSAFDADQVIVIFTGLGVLIKFTAGVKIAFMS